MLNTGTEHLQNTLVVICICTFLVYHPIMSLKRCPFYSSCSLHVKKSHEAIWNWIQKYKPQAIYTKKNDHRLRCEAWNQVVVTIKSDISISITSRRLGGLIGIIASSNVDKVDTSNCEFRIYPKESKWCVLNITDSPFLKSKSETSEQDRLRTPIG